MEKNNIWRRELTTAKNNCEETNSLLSSQVDDIKSCLLMPPNIILNLESYKNLLEEEQIIFSKLKNCNLFIDELFTSHNIQFWFQLEEDLINSEKLFTLSRG